MDIYTNPNSTQNSGGYISNITLVSHLFQFVYNYYILDKRANWLYVVNIIIEHFIFSI